MHHEPTVRHLYSKNDGDTGIIRAAAKPDTARLEALLALHAVASAEDLSEREKRQLQFLGPDGIAYGSAYSFFLSPIISAIDAHLPSNILALLKAGADPNGMARFSKSDYSVRFIRGRHFKEDTSSFVVCNPRATILANAQQKGITHQFCPLTESELHERSQGFPWFWTEPNVPGQRLRMRKPLTGLENAAKVGDIEIFDILRSAGADESAWTHDVSLDEKQFQIEDADWSISFMSTSSPIHEAIAAGQQTMLRHLLFTCGHSPNYRSYVTPTAALPPLSFAIARCDLNEPGVQRCLVDLLSHLQLDANLRTPVFGIHPLHFATAHHNPDLLSWLASYIPGGLGSAGTTALGDNLLHIASLPLTAQQIIGRNSIVARSLHCVRALTLSWLPHARPSPLHTLTATPEELALNGKPTPMTEPQQLAQQCRIKLLLEWGGNRSQGTGFRREYCVALLS
ncbi:unnamed protein product, partial [Penicillium bialowiezense]